MTGSVRSVTPKRRFAGTVCRKCAGKAGTKPAKAAKAIARAVGAATGEKVVVGEVGCLKLCPKRHVVVLDAAGRAHLVPSEGWEAGAARLLAAPTG